MFRFASILHKDRYRKKIGSCSAVCSIAGVSGPDSRQFTMINSVEIFPIVISRLLSLI